MYDINSCSSETFLCPIELVLFLIANHKNIIYLNNGMDAALVVLSYLQNI